MAGACAVAAILLSLSISGTLSSWTQAIITNSTNSVATKTAVILQESTGSATCASSDGAQTTVNSYSCTTINKYGGVSSPLSPGGSVSTDVTFTNLGSAAGTSFVLAPGTCTSSPTSGTPTPTNLCTTAGALTVTMGCNTGTTYGSGTAWASPFVISGIAPGNLSASYTHPATGSDLAAAASWTCRITVALSATAPIAAQGVTVTQPLTWTLNG